MREGGVTMSDKDTATELRPGDNQQEFGWRHMANVFSYLLVVYFQA
jgi:hypothetical protein